MAKRKKRISIYCEYCQCYHDINEVDVEIDGEDVNVYCQKSGLCLWLQREDKQKLMDLYNN